jgi:hypothetical protein
MLNLALRSSLVSALLLAVTQPAWPQRELAVFTGKVQGDIDAACAGARAAAPTGTIQVRRGRADWQGLVEREKIASEDAVRVARFLDARFSIEPQTGANGTLFLVPDLACYRNLAAKQDTMIAGLRLRQHRWASYEIFADTVARGGRRVERLGISIERGGLIVQWKPGKQLFIMAAGDTATVTGTTVVVLVDSTGRNALFYVEGGTMTMARLARPVVQSGEVVRVESGRSRRLQTRLANSLGETAQYFSETVWRGQPRAPGAPRDAVVPARSGLPWRTIGLVAGATGLAAIVVTMVTDDDSPRDGRHAGTVIVRIPL